MKQFILYCLTLLAFAGCKYEGKNDRYSYYEYEINNNSGHLLTLHFDSVHFPAVLTIENGDSYSWMREDSFPHPFLLDIHSYVMFDDNVKLSVPNFAAGREIAQTENFTTTQTGHNTYRCQYTFTSEDYDYAAAHNEHGYEYEYTFTNDSGHQLAMLFHDTYGFPLVVIIKDGENHRWENHLSWFAPFRLHGESYITYDSTVKPSVENFAHGRDITNAESYTAEHDGQLHAYTYTFTVEDYDYAAAHNEYDEE